MRARDYNVSGLYLRSLLSSIRKTTGNQYARVLEKSGLGQFIQKYPPPTLETVTKGEQIINLSIVVEQQIGPELYGLFLRNIGREFGNTMANVPELRALAKAIQPNLNRATLSQLIERVGALNYKSLNELVEVQPGSLPNEIVVIYRNCFACAERTSEKPRCPSIVAFYKQFVLELTGLRCMVEETKCGAVTGEYDCHFLLKWQTA